MTSSALEEKPCLQCVDRDLFINTSVQYWCGRRRLVDGPQQPKLNVRRTCGLKIEFRAPIGVVVVVLCSCVQHRGTLSPTVACLFDESLQLPAG